MVSTPKRVIGERNNKSFYAEMVVESTPFRHSVYDGMGELEWKTSFGDIEINLEDSINTTIRPKYGFYNPSEHKSMNGAKFLSFLDIESIVQMVSEKYRNLKHFHYPIEAMLKTIIYQRMMSIRKNTHLESILHEKKSIVPKYLNYNRDRDGNYIPPDRITLFHFVNKRLKLRGLLEVEDMLLRMVNEECAKHNIQLGKRIGIDSTPFEAMQADREAVWNGHYELWMYKIHQITCLDTNISIGKIVTYGNDFDGDFLIPMLNRLKRSGIQFEEIYGDNHYSTFKNWATITTKFGAKCIFKIAESDTIRQDGTVEWIKKIYNKFWTEDDYIEGIDINYMAKFLLEHGVYIPIGAYYRNKWMLYWEQNPIQAQELYNRRTEVERFHSHIKNELYIEKNLNVKGLHKVKIYVTTFWIMQLAIALTRLQNDITKGLFNTNNRIFT